MRTKRDILAFLVCGIAVSAPAQTFTTLVSFNNSSGAAPLYESLVQGLDGAFYGTTANGGSVIQPNCPYGCGTIFKVTASGVLTSLLALTYSNGAFPYAGLALASDGYFYGTTKDGGPSGGLGTIFKITRQGTLTMIYGFAKTSTAGAHPYAALVQASNGNFYGSTANGGANNYGTIFQVTRGGTLTTLHSFDSTDGANPYARLVQASDGNLYGTAPSGGAHGYGTIFQITTAGALTVLHEFAYTDGANPYAGLLQGADGNLYGTTAGGGMGYGTVFQTTLAGALTTLHSFNSTDGGSPFAPLIQATDGNFYGATVHGGASNYGALFELTPNGTLTTLHSFDLAGGAYPSGGLLQATDGNLYGTTNGGGTANDGTVFALSVGLGPFVKEMPTRGAVGSPIRILGTNLTGATSVTFNGTPATFTVVSAALIMARVPAGATTGPIQVATPNGTLLSNTPFSVL